MKSGDQAVAICALVSRRRDDHRSREFGDRPIARARHNVGIVKCWFLCDFVPHCLTPVLSVMHGLNLMGDPTRWLNLCENAVRRATDASRSRLVWCGPDAGGILALQPLAAIQIRQFGFGVDLPSSPVGVIRSTECSTKT